MERRHGRGHGRGRARAAATAAALFAGLTVLVATTWGPLHRLDVATSAAARRAVGPHPGVVDLLQVLTALGRPVVVVVLVVLGVVGLAVRRGRRADAAAVLATALATVAVRLVVRDAVDRPRPPGALVHATGAAYPSGHATGAAFLAAAAAMLVRRAWATAVAAAYAVLVAVTRVLLVVHWPTDVVAGLLLGGAGALLLPVVADVARRTRLGAHPPVGG